MGHCRASLLADRGVLRVSGADARKFLQGLITNDIGKAADGKAIHAGLLSPQGKILFDFFVVPHGNGFLLDVARAKLEELAKRLGFYRLRAQVESAEEPELAVWAVWEGPPRQVEGGIVFADPRLPELGFRVIGKPEVAAEFGCRQASEAEYHELRIKLGIPEGGRDYVFGDTFPHEALFDQLNGVDFGKGCYVGQEVVSRVEHRGTARKRIVPVEGEAALTAGASVDADGVPLGVVGSVSGASGLALLRLQFVDQALAEGKEIRAGGVRIAVRRPSFARFAVPAMGATA